MTDERSDTASLSPWWRHAAILVMIFGFSTLSFVTVQTYDNAPPIPARVVDRRVERSSPTTTCCAGRRCSSSTA